MTLEELKSEMTDLVFDLELPADSLLISAANRALREIYIRRKITNTVRLYTRGLQPSFYREAIHCTGGTEITLPLDGVAFSMRVCGYGNYAVYDGSLLNVYSIDTGIESNVVKHFISEGGKIVLWADTSFDVYDFSVYSEVYSTKKEDIPDGGNRVTIDMRSIYPDFSSFTTPAQDSSGNPIKGCLLADGKIELDSDYSGEIILTYRRLPTKIGTSVSEEIDIPAEYSHLLPLLATSYILLDADPSIASHYRERYEDLLSRMERNTYEQISTKYVDVNGWA